MAPRASPLSSLSLLLVVALLARSASAAASESALAILKSTDDVKVGPSILAIGAVVAGGLMCVAGYRFFRITIFVCGFIVGGIAIASAVEWILKNQSYLETASWIGFFIGGIVVGSIAMSLYSTSIFIAGAAGGVMLAFTIHTTVAYKLNQNNPDVVLVVLAILLGILGGVLAIKIEKPVLVAATSFVGAIAVAWGVGYFAGDFPNAADLKHYSTKDLNGDTIISVPHAWWGYLVGIVVMFVLGVYIQLHKTGRDGDYHKSSRSNNVPARTNANGVSHV